ncbi:recombinase family protein [Acutalibacter sp. JLR.KK004]|uniref:recombinase family protein n=1 Tax=Acutalibacter sp. JLR.KK004 TaxID=3112622 RepID=UPI002FEEF454
MVDREKQDFKEAQKRRTRQRIQNQAQTDHYEYTPENPAVDYFGGNTPLRVAVYARVSTDNVQQTSSYELQKKYYEGYVVRHPNWILCGLYCDEGVSGTTDRHRDGFNQMLADCRAGKLDLIITKSVSRFARNLVLCISIVLDLKALSPPVGVFFESESIFSLNEEKSMSLSFFAMMAEEESHIRSRSMETSLRMRLDHGLPLTPELLGYRHDEEGGLVINPEEAPTVKLAFFMYLYGCSTRQIAETFNVLGRKSYLGNVKWTANGIVGILRNERHCGQVYTRKTFTPNFRDHRSVKNRGERPHSRYLEHHEPIVSPADFTAVQRMLDNARFRGHEILPRLRVVESGLLKGFVVVHPRWAGFGEADYTRAAQSVGTDSPPRPQIELHPGDLDLRGFQAVRPELYDSPLSGFVSFREKSLSLSTQLVRQLSGRDRIELLLDPIGRRIALRPAEPENRYGVVCARRSGGRYHPRAMPSAAFGGTLFKIFGWDTANFYRIIPALYQSGDELVFLCEAADAQAFLPETACPAGQIYTPYRERVRYVPTAQTGSFGPDYYLVRTREAVSLAGPSRVLDDGSGLKTTDRKTLGEFIRRELAGFHLEEPDGN